MLGGLIITYYYAIIEIVELAYNLFVYFYLSLFSVQHRPTKLTEDLLGKIFKKYILESPKPTSLLV
jgi:hypothetical protein